MVLPAIGYTFTAPGPLLDSARFQRIHNRVSKEALRLALLVHRQETIPEHFKQTNRGKYDHHPRFPPYKAFKRAKYGSITDLKKTGETARHMKTQLPNIRIGGNATSRLKGTMFLKFPFPVNFSHAEKGVGPREMAIEIARWTQQDARSVARAYGRFYVELLEKELAKSPKLLKKVKPQLAAVRSFLGG